MSRPARLAAHSELATSLALLSDHELAGLVESGVPVGTGIGGRSCTSTWTDGGSSSSACR